LSLLFWSEIGNILWKCVRTGRLSEKSARAALADMLHHSLPTVPGRELAEDAWTVALATGRTVFDSMYVALALQKDAAFVTADERLVNAMASRWPVKWLGVL